MTPTIPIIKETQIDVAEQLCFTMISSGAKNVTTKEARVSIQESTYARRASPFLNHLKEMCIVPKEFLKASFAASLIIPIVLPRFFLKIQKTTDFVNGLCLGINVNFCLLNYYQSELFC
jgi:hypothetical protein